MLDKDIFVAQAKVARQIDHFQVRRQLRGNLDRLPVWQREENAVEIFQCIQLFRRVAEGQVSQAVKILVDLANALARMFLRSDQSDLGIGVLQQNAKKFRSAVT